MTRNLVTFHLVAWHHIPNLQVCLHWTARSKLQNTVLTLVYGFVCSFGRTRQSTGECCSRNTLSCKSRDPYETKVAQAFATAKCSSQACALSGLPGQCLKCRGPLSCPFRQGALEPLTWAAQLCCECAWLCTNCAGSFHISCGAVSLLGITQGTSTPLNFIHMYWPESGRQTDAFD